MAEKGELVDPIPNQPSAEKTSRSVTHISAELFRGPLPPPKLLEEYERIVPGSAKTLLNRAGKEQKHRHQEDIEASNIVNRGLTYSFILSLTLMVGGMYLIAIGKDIAGLALILGPLVGIVASFTFTRIRQKNDIGSE